MRYRVADVVMQMLERDASEGGDARSGPLIDSRVCHELLLPAMAEVYVIYKYIHIYVCICICICTCICVCICMYIYLYVYICMHTYTHRFTSTLPV